MVWGDITSAGRERASDAKAPLPKPTDRQTDSKAKKIGTVLHYASLQLYKTRENERMLTQNFPHVVETAAVGEHMQRLMTALLLVHWAQGMHSLKG